MNKKIKAIFIIVFFLIALILSAIGYLSYLKSNVIDIHFGIGGNVDTEYEEKVKMKKGTFVKCTENSNEISNTMYVEFINNKLVNEIIQYQMIANISEEQIKKNSKEYIEYRLMDYTCTGDKDTSLCGNVKFKWNKNTVTSTYAVLANFRNEKWLGISQDEFIEKATKKQLTCEKVFESPIYSTKLDPAGTYYNRYKKYLSNNTKKETNNNSSNKTADIVAINNTFGYIDAIEYYAGLSEIEPDNSVSLPVAKSGNVICETKDGITWTGNTVPNSSSCTDFMKAVISNKRGKIPKTAKIIIDNNGKVQFKSWFKYGIYYCIYNDNQVFCSTNKPQ